MTKVVTFFQENIILILILTISVFFRFYKFYSLEYFSGDEEIFYFLLKKIVEVRPILVVPNAQLSSSIGSFFHLLSSPLYYLTDGSPILMPIFGSILGVFTTYLVYLAGKLIAGRKLGYIASFLYASSALISLFDRRWWALTPDSFFAVIHIIGIVRLAEKKLRYLFLLLFPAFFSWHSDPSLAVLLVSSVLVFVIFKLPLLKREYVLTFIFLITSLLPFLVFEIRHPGTIFRPFIVHLLHRNVNGTAVDRNSGKSLSLKAISQNFTRIFFLAPSEKISQYFHYENLYPKPLGYPFTFFVLFAVVFIKLWYLVFSKKFLKGIEIKKFFSPYFVLVSFLLGVFIYYLILRYSVHQHYYIVVFPAIILIISQSLFILYNNKYQKLVYSFLFLIFFVNLFTLLNYRLAYPTIDKLIFLEKLSSEVDFDNSSLYVFGSRDITDGGWIYLLASKNIKVQRSYLNWGWDWIYRSHGLFPYDPNQPDGKYVVIIHETGNRVIKDFFSEKFLNSVVQGEISATILDNSQGWYNDQLLGNMQSEYNRGQL